MQVFSERCFEIVLREKPLLESYFDDISSSEGP